MEIKAVKLEKKNPTDLSVGDILIITGAVLVIVGLSIGGVYGAGFVALS